jgi:hypothetical protein
MNWKILADTRHSETKSIPNIHILHTHDNIVVITQESSIEVHDKLRVGIVHDLQFPDNPTAHLFLGLNMDDLGKDQLDFASITLPVCYH